MLYVLLPVVALGHLALHVALVNRAHATGLPRWLLKIGDGLWYLSLLGIPLALGPWLWLRHGAADLGAADLGAADVARWPGSSIWLPYGYSVLCVVAAVWFVGDRLWRQRHCGTTPRLEDNHAQIVDVARRLGKRPVGDALTALLSRLPGNEILRLSIHEKRLRLVRWQPAWGELRVTHLSDLHLTGQLTRDFYSEVVRQANAWPSDLVAITGDIVEAESCLDWIGPTLGQLQARHGVYFVLGNHDLKIQDPARVRRALTAAGLIDLGGRWLMLQPQPGCHLVLAGNELPWFRPAADLACCAPQVDGRRPFRVLLSHSPDQLAWARAHDCDLQLAGHTHGGQVRLPWIGPILSPSLQGSRHAAGTFYYPPTLLHVSRGIAGTRPLRWNCPPELARLRLVADASGT